SPMRQAARPAISCASSTKPPLQWEFDMQDLEIVFDPLPGDALRRFVVDQLDAHVLTATGEASYYPVGYFLKSPRGEWLGGLLGTLWGGWLHPPGRAKYFMRKQLAATSD